SRTVSFSSPRLARTRFFPGASPRTAPVFPGGENARASGGQDAHRGFFFPASRTHAHLRWARRAPCLCLLGVSHARGSFRVQAHARLLFSRAGRKPAPAASKTRTVSFSSPRLARTRTCGGQVAHRVFFFSASRTHAVLSGCKPTHGSCFPGR